MPPPGAHHYLVVGDFEVRQRFVAVHFDLIPGDSIDPAGGFIDEVMVTFRIRIEEHRVGSEMQLPEQALLHEEIERVVDGRTGDRREILSSDGPHFVGGGMLLSSKNILRNSDALCRWLDVVLFETCTTSGFISRALVCEVMLLESVERAGHDHRLS